MYYGIVDIYQKISALKINESSMKLKKLDK